MDNVHFKSRNNPVKTFYIKTKQDDLKVKEISLKDKGLNRELLSSADLFIYNFATNTKDPSFLKFLNMPQKEYYENVKSHACFLKQMLKRDDGNITYLVAKDESGKIQASCLTSSLNEFGNVTDKKTLYVDAVAVNKNYRSNHVGSIMLNQIIKASKDKFSDVVLTADRCAVPAYQKGWKLQEFKPENEVQNKVLEVMKNSRPDYPDYVTFMHRPLDKNQQRWWERMAQLLDKKELPWWKRIF